MQCTPLEFRVLSRIVGQEERAMCAPVRVTHTPRDICPVDRLSTSVLRERERGRGERERERDGP